MHLIAMMTDWLRIETFWKAGQLCHYVMYEYTATDYLLSVDQFANLPRGICQLIKWVNLFVSYRKRAFGAILPALTVVV